LYIDHADHGSAFDGQQSWYQSAFSSQPPWQLAEESCVWPHAEIDASLEPLSFLSEGCAAQ